MKLYDFAVTPQVFEPQQAADSQDWLLAVHGLTCFLHGASPPPLVVCNLRSECGGIDWEHAARTAIERIADHKHRRYAMDLLTEIKKVLVRRLCPKPTRHAVSESHWIEALAKSHRQVAFDGLVTRAPTAAGQIDLHATSLADAVRAFEAMRRQSVTARPTAETIADQVRVMFRYSDRIILTMPYGWCHDFAVTCLRRNLVTDARVREVCLHLKGNRSGVDGYASHWKKQLQRQLKHVKVTCHFWTAEALPRERMILGCELKDVCGQQLKPKVRWGMGSSHVPGEGDGAANQPAFQKWLEPKVAQEQLVFLSTDLVGRGVISVPLN